MASAEEKHEKLYELVREQTTQLLLLSQSVKQQLDSLRTSVDQLHTAMYLDPAVVHALNRVAEDVDGLKDVQKGHMELMNEFRDHKTVMATRWKFVIAISTIAAAGTVGGLIKYFLGV